MRGQTADATVYGLTRLFLNTLHGGWLSLQSEKMSMAEQNRIYIQVKYYRQIRWRCLDKIQYYLLKFTTTVITLGAKQHDTPPSIRTDTEHLQTLHHL